MKRPLLVAMLAFSIGAGACGEGESGEPITAATPAGVVATTVPAPSGPSALDPPATEAAARGQKLFQGTCVACHGMDALGLPGLGKPLVGNVFLAGLSDAEAVEFLIAGRPADHPDNTVGIAMPPMGGNTALSDQDLSDLVAFLRSLAG